MSGKTVYATLPLYTRFGVSHFDLLQVDQSPKRPFPDLKKTAEIILHTLKVAGSNDKEKAKQAKILLDDWTASIDQESESLKKLCEDGIAFLASDTLSNKTSKSVEGSFPVVWDDSRIWKTVRMLMMVDDMVYRLSTAQKTEFISIGDMKKRQKAIASPLRRVFSEVVRSSKVLFVSQNNIPIVASK